MDPGARALTDASVSGAVIGGGERAGGLRRLVVDQAGELLDLVGAQLASELRHLRVVAEQVYLARIADEAREPLDAATALEVRARATLAGFDLVAILAVEHLVVDLGAL